MAAILRKGAPDMKTSAARRHRLGWRRRVTTFVLAGTAVAVLLTCALPYPVAVSLVFPRFHVHSSTFASLSTIDAASVYSWPPLSSALLYKAEVVSRLPINSASQATGMPAAPPSPRQPSAIGNSGTRRGNSSSEIKIVLPLRPEKAYWRMAPDEALRFAKREIQNAPLVVDDPELHAQLFHNASVFQRSYELMEKILKVYIYKDGSTPIFHTPRLRGIYASEGWFMKLMEENKQFVVKNPSKAHLFYLPYSARQLKVALYVPGSHNMRPIALFLRDYVNMLAGKYPFWNRTGGADHFLVACHDWGSYTTTKHKELHRNTIKALCNADISEGIFIRGKDVSLPETTIRAPKKPLQNVGGMAVSQRPILAFFAGNMHGRVRPVLLKYWGDKDDDMKIYGPLPNQVSRKMSYVQHMKSSKFCICPMGYEVNSPRIVEAIYYECVPVIIADNFVLPFEEVLDWSGFSVVVAEKDIPNLKNILLGISQRRYLSMQNRVRKVQKHFLWHAKPLNSVAQAIIRIADRRIGALGDYKKKGYAF